VALNSGWTPESAIARSSPRCRCVYSIDGDRGLLALVELARRYHRHGRLLTGTPPGQKTSLLIEDGYGRREGEQRGEGWGGEDRALADANVVVLVPGSPSMGDDVQDTQGRHHGKSQTSSVHPNFFFQFPISPAPLSLGGDIKGISKPDRPQKGWLGCRLCPNWWRPMDRDN